MKICKRNVYTCHDVDVVCSLSLTQILIYLLTTHRNKNIHLLLKTQRYNVQRCNYYDIFVYSFIYMELRLMLRFMLST